MKSLAKMFGLAVTWYSGKLIVEIFEEILYERLHKNKHYNRLLGRKKVKKTENNIQSITGRKMGF